MFFTFGMTLRLLEIFDKRERIVLAVMVGLSLMAAALETIGVGAVLPFVRFAMDPSAIHSSGPLEYVYGLTGFGSEEVFVVFLALGLVIAFIVKNAFFFFALYFQQDFLSRKRAKCSVEMYRGYLTSPYEFHLKQNSALLLRNINRIDEIFSGLLQPLFLIFTEAVVSICLLGFLAWVEPWLTLGALAAVAVPSILLYRLLGSSLSELGVRNHQLAGASSKSLLEGLRGVKEIRVAGVEDKFARDFEDDALALGLVRRNLQLANNVPRLVIEPILVLGLIVIIVAMFLGGRAGPDALPLLALFGVASVRVMAAVSKILPGLQQLRFHEVLNETVLKDLRQFQVRSDSISLEDPGCIKDETSTSVSVRGLAYRYPGSERYALKSVSFQIPAGSRVAIVGVSGSGKSTLMDILLGLFDPAEGEVLVGGVPLRSRLTEWRSIIGYIPQSVFLIDDSLRRNVAFGIPDEKIDDRMVWDALEIAQLGDVVRGLPDGLDTGLGERGVRLSGGQRQRVAIARALYHTPSVLLMDEATSALDPETEQEIAGVIENLFGSKTIVIIAHRMRTIRGCQQIIWLDSGMVVDVASFDQLCQRHPKFRAFAASDAFAV